MVNGETTVSDKLAVVLSWVALESFTVTATVLVPVAVAVPLITPDPALMERPPGSPVADHW
jgi:hypothetical protein